MIEIGLTKLITNTKNNKRIGLLCHPASINKDYIHTVDILLKHNTKLTTILSPQHGLKGEKQDNMIESPHHIDPITKLAVYSLYSETRTPMQYMLDNIDVLVIDLQDIGTRVYTFISTMALSMKACKKYNKEVIVLDRPNPINAISVEGNVLNPNLMSFVGIHTIPMRHGMTIAELALMFNHESNINCKLKVIKMTNYDRAMWFDNTDLPWIYPSPNIPKLDSALVYPGTVLIEGTKISEGRGTTMPFELIGAPYINPYKLKALLDSYGLLGVYFRPVYFEPCFHKFSNEVCGGIQLHITNRDTFKPYLTGLSIIKAVKNLYPKKDLWKNPPYEYEYEKLPIDLLIGDKDIRKALSSNLSIKSIEAKWQTKLNNFLEIRKKYLLYS